MKKLLSLIAIAVFGVGSVFAQTVATAPVKTTTKKVVVETKKDGKAAVKKTEVTTKKVAENTKSHAVKLKKDGTPDKRYKKSGTHLKKDGTADMRYKENKKSK